MSCQQSQCSAMIKFVILSMSSHKQHFFNSVTYRLFLIKPYTLFNITTWDFEVNFVSWCINPWGRETNKKFPTPVHLLTSFQFPTIPAVLVDCISVTATAKETLYTIHITQRNRQMKWCPPARIQKLFIVLHINHKQTEKNCWSCFVGLRLKPNLQNMLEHTPCSMQVPLPARRSLYARRASVMGNLKGFYPLKFREEKRTKCPSLHWPPFFGLLSFFAHPLNTIFHPTDPFLPQVTQVRRIIPFHSA